MQCWRCMKFGGSSDDGGDDSSDDDAGISTTQRL